MTFDVFLIASYIGAIAFALSGFIIGVRKNFDIMGVFIVSFLAANGGGILRDVFIGRMPLAITDLSNVLIVIGTFFFGLALHYMRSIDIERHKIFVISDSIGLAAFSVTGALAGLDAGLGLFGVIVLSFLTATGGGILRDLLINEIPLVLRSDFYGSVAVLAAISLYALYYFGLTDDVYIIAAFIVLLGIRLLAYKMQWRLPSLKLK